MYVCVRGKTRVDTRPTNNLFPVCTRCSFMASIIGAIGPKGGEGGKKQKWEIKKKKCGKTLRKKKKTTKSDIGRQYIYICDITIVRSCCTVPALFTHFFHNIYDNILYYSPSNVYVYASRQYTGKYR